MTQQPTISTEAVAVLRKAAKNAKAGERHYIVVRYTPDPTTPIATVTIGQEIDNGEAVEPRYATKRVEIPVLGSLDKYDGSTAVTYVASSQHYASSSVSALRTLAALVKPGDVLRVLFYIGNNTETLKKAELAHDEAYIVVYRNGKVVGDVFVDDVIAPQYSTARFGTNWS